MKVGGFTNKEASLALWLHDEYERISKESNWKTQKKCQVIWDELPLENRMTMLRLARRLMEVWGFRQ